MANTIIALKQSGATGNTPVVESLEFGELAVNHADGILYFRTSSNTLGSIRTTQPSGLSGEVQFNDAGSFGSDSTFTFNKTTNILTVDNAVVGSLNVAPTLQASFDKANAANLLAQAAFDTANSANSSDFTTVSVTPGTYGNASAIPSITIEANGRVSNITTQTFEAATIGDVLAISIALG
jgi:hypothetical protein